MSWCEVYVFKKWSWNKYWKYSQNDATLQKFIYKHIKDFENVQSNKKKKGRFTGCLSSN
jgi:hypothetical protein